MARGPSHSRSSRSSTRSSSRSSSRSFRSPGGSFRTTRHTYSTIGHYGPRRTVVVHGNPKSALISVLVFVIFFAGIFCFSTFNIAKSVSNEIKYMKSDSIEYYDMIEKANNGNSSVKTTEAKITGAYCDCTYSGEEFYYVEYLYYNEYSNRYLEGWTYSQFTYYDLMKLGYTTGNTITIVYESDGDNINMNYEFENAQYLSNVSSKNISTIVCVISVLVIIACVVGMGKIAKTMKNSTTTTTTSYGDNPFNNQNTDFNFPNYNINEKKPMYCSYCGSMLEENEIKCNSCGATIKK